MTALLGVTKHENPNKIFAQKKTFSVISCLANAEAGILTRSHAYVDVDMYLFQKTQQYTQLEYIFKNVYILCYYCYCDFKCGFTLDGVFCFSCRPVMICYYKSFFKSC